MSTAESLEATRLFCDASLRLHAQRTTLTAAFEPLAHRGLVETAVDPGDLPLAHEAGSGRRVEG